MGLPSHIYTVIITFEVNINLTFLLNYTGRMEERRMGGGGGNSTPIVLHRKSIISKLKTQEVPGAQDL